MKLTMMGTGNALVTEIYNTCFVIEDSNQYFMVDGGGGNQILTQLKRAGYNWMDMKDIFITHKHLDHIMGIIWMVRMICQYMVQGQYEGEARIYGHAEVLQMVEEISRQLIQAKHTKMIGKRLHFIVVEDGQEVEIIHHKVTFFDIQSTKAKQFGFSMELNDHEKLTCCGDEPFNECEVQYAKDSKWLLHEAFCLYGQRDIFHPYEKNHSTVKDAAELAEKLNVANLILYHSEDANILRRKELYGEEGRKYYSGNLYIPDDLESFEL